MLQPIRVVVTIILLFIIPTFCQLYINVCIGANIDLIDVNTYIFHQDMTGESANLIPAYIWTANAITQCKEFLKHICVALSIGDLLHIILMIILIISAIKQYG